MHKNSSIIRNSFETVESLSLVLNTDLCVIHAHMSTYCIEILLKCTLDGFDRECCRGIHVQQKC